jgi:putative acetyltransferase
MGYSLRPAGTGDSAHVRVVVARVLGEYGMLLDEGGPDADLVDIGASYVKSGGCFHVLVDEQGRVAGSVGLMPKGDGVAELRKMYLVREARGRGLGKVMLRTVLEDARRLGFRRITLETATPMKEAQQLYVSHGFKRMSGCCATSRCDQSYELELSETMAAPPPAWCMRTARVHGLIPMAHAVEVERSSAFYALLGFSVERQMKDHAGSTFWAMLRSGGAAIMFARASGPVDASEQAVLFYMYAADVKALRVKLIAAGVEDGGDYCGQIRKVTGKGAVFALTNPDYMPAGEIRVEDPDGYCLLVGQDG